MVYVAPSYADFGAATRQCSSDETDVGLGAKPSESVHFMTYNDVLYNHNLILTYPKTSSTNSYEIVIVTFNCSLLKV